MTGLLILAVTIGVLVGMVVYIFLRASHRESAIASEGVSDGTSGRFWPQSSIGQLGAVALVLIVAAMLASLVAMGD